MPVFGDKPIDEISRSDIKDFLYAKQSEKLAPGTVRIIRAYLTAILTEAVDDELITDNPAARTGRFICAGEVRKKANPPSWEERIDNYYTWMPGTRKSEVDKLDLTAAPDCTPYAPSHENAKEKGLTKRANPL